MASYEQKGPADASSEKKEGIIAALLDLDANDDNARASASPHEDVEEARPPGEAAHSDDDDEPWDEEEAPNDDDADHDLILSVLTGAPLVPTRVPTFREPLDDDDDDGGGLSGSETTKYGRRETTGSLSGSERTSRSLGLSALGLDLSEAGYSTDGLTQEELSRIGLTKSEQAWDITRSGKLDPASRALKAMDSEKRGRLSRAQQHELMTEHLEAKRALSRFRKGVYT